MSLTLLIVDEEPARLEGRASHLRACGYRVFSASSGKEAQRALIRGWFEAACIVLHSTSTPLADADFLIAKQSDPRFAHIPVVLLADRPDHLAPPPPPIRAVVPPQASHRLLASAIHDVLGDAAPGRGRARQAVPGASPFDEGEITDVG